MPEIQQAEARRRGEKTSISDTRDGGTETGPALPGEVRIHDRLEQRAPAPLDGERLGERERERPYRQEPDPPELRDHEGRQGPAGRPVKIHPGDLRREPRIKGNQGPQREVPGQPPVPHRGGLHHQRFT